MAIFAGGQGIRDSGGSKVAPKEYDSKSESVRRWHAKDVVFEIGQRESGWQK